MPNSDEIIHYWPAISDVSPCGIDLMTTSYTYGTPDPAEVTCPECKGASPPAPIYRYRVSFVVVNADGAVLKAGSTDIEQHVPIPEGEGPTASFHATATSGSLRKACDEAGVPAGRVVVTTTRAI